MNTPSTPQKLSKTMGEILFSLFGPNGCDAIVHHGEKRQMDVYRELERHGLVSLVEREGNMRGLYDVKRMTRGLKA